MDREQSEFRVSIHCGNAAFDDFDGHYDPGAELARILREIADRVERGDLSGYYETIRDANGNDVGRWGLKHPYRL